MFSTSRLMHLMAALLTKQLLPLDTDQGTPILVHTMDG